jgi:peptidoglycan hydrolase-like protein with peptidoglycan-binding domain
MRFRFRLAAVAAVTILATAVGGAATVPAAQAKAGAGGCYWTGSEPTQWQGHSGYAVRQIQCEFNMSVRGPKLVVDGSFGPATKAAIVRFQKCVGVYADGIVGPTTWSHLNYQANRGSRACY